VTKCVSGTMENHAMETDEKPRRVRARIRRTVTEVAIVLLDKEGNVEELGEVLEELQMDDVFVEDIQAVHSVHS